MSSPDKIPPIRHDLPFPHGDMLDITRELNANEWIARAETETYGDFMNRINRGNKYVPLSGVTGPALTRSALNALCHTWNRAKGDDRDLALQGYRIATAFNHDTLYLPIRNINLAESFRQMRDEQRDLAPVFAQTVWKGMESYRYVHDKFDRLFEHSRTRILMYSDEDKDYFRAGMALVYMHSWASSMADEALFFNGMKNQTEEPQDLRLTDFRDFFTKD